MMAHNEDEDLPIAEAIDPRLGMAADLLEQAVQAGLQDPQVAYLLALTHKQQGNLAEARAALRKIARPSGKVWLQFGLLSLEEGQLAQAEQELQRAWELEPNAFAAAYNLVMTRLQLGLRDAALASMPALIQLTITIEKRRLLTALQQMLVFARDLPASEGIPVLPLGEPGSLLEALSPGEEVRLSRLLRTLGHAETVFALVRVLLAARPSSGVIRELYLEAALVRARELMTRCLWTEVRWMLQPLLKDRLITHAQLAAVNNMLGVCGYLTQDFARASKHFQAALEHCPNDPRLHQNVALAQEQCNELTQADTHWSTFLELLDQVPFPVPPDVPEYLETLEFETLLRVAGLLAQRERWKNVLGYLQRAHRLRPTNEDVIERQFHVYCHLKQPGNARKALKKLRQLRPGDPQFDLYELDLVEVKNLNDIERLLTEIERILHHHPDDHRVEERAVRMVGEVVPLIANLSDQFGEQLAKVLGQIKNLPRYQINWTVVQQLLRDLGNEFRKLRRIIGKCLPLVTNEEHKRIVRDLAELIDEKIEQCRATPSGK